MARLPPKDSTIKKLFSLSGNACAFPGCTQRLVTDEEALVGEICHIEAAESGGERYNPNQTDEERRSFTSLILLCANHHKITNNVTLYPVDVMREMKARHEAQFKERKFLVPNNVIKQYRNHFNTSFYNSVTDQTQTIINQGEGAIHVDQKNSTFQQIGVQNITHATYITKGSKNYKKNKKVENTKKILEASVLKWLYWSFLLVFGLIIVQVFFLFLAIIFIDALEVPFFMVVISPSVFGSFLWGLAHSRFRRVGDFEKLQRSDRSEIVTDLKEIYSDNSILSWYMKLCIDHFLDFDKRYQNPKSPI